MSGTGWFAIMILGMWALSTVAVCVTKDGAIYIVVGFITILAGLGYIELH